MAANSLRRSVGIIEKQSGGDGERHRNSNCCSSNAEGLERMGRFRFICFGRYKRGDSEYWVDRRPSSSPPQLLSQVSHVQK